MALITSLSPLYLRRPRRRKLPITAWLTVGCPGNRTRLSVMRVRRLDHYTKRHPAVAAYGQGHHHNGDQVARPPNMMRSICGRRYATSWFVIRGGHGWANSVAGPWVPISSPLAHGLSRNVFELFSWFQRRFSPPLRPPVRPGYDYKYRSRSYRFVERQKRDDVCRFCCRSTKR